MTENEMLKIAIHCLSVQSEQEVCEECDIYGNCHTDCKDVAVAAIKALEEIQQYRAIGAVEECREAVEKQKPKKPDYEGDGYDDKGELVYDTWICPNCDKKYEVDYDDYKHCPNCGQAIAENLEGMEDE